MEEKIRIGIKYGNMAFLAIFAGFLALNLFLYFIFEELILPEFSEEMFEENLSTALLFLLRILVINPISEEGVFRLIPINIASRIWGRENKIVWTVIIISSIIFGLIHGSWRNIFLQGSAGIVFSIAFLKGGYISSAVAHSYCNLLIAMLSIMKILFF